MKVGDTIQAPKDLTYTYKGKQQVVKKGFSMIIKAIIGDQIVLDRFGKPFIIDKQTLQNP
jgi:hypothetical protein